MSSAIYPWCYVLSKQNNSSIHTLQCPLSNLKLEGKIIHHDNLRADYIENPIYDAFGIIINQKMYMLWGNSFSRIDLTKDLSWLGSEYNDNFCYCVRTNSENVWVYEERIKFTNAISDDIYRLFIFE